MSPLSIKSSKLALILGSFLLLLLLSACTGSALAATSWPGLSVSNGVAFIAFNQRVYAVDTSTGRELWRFPIEEEGNPTFYAPPATTANGLLIVGSYSNFAVALNADSGAEVWRFDRPGGKIVGAPAVGNGLVLLPSADRTLYAANLAAGSFVWDFTTDWPLWAGPVIHEGTVYQASLGHNLYALDLESGDERWRQDLGGAVVDSPSLADGLLLQDAGWQQGFFDQAFLQPAYIQLAWGDTCLD